MCYQIIIKDIYFIFIQFLSNYYLCYKMQAFYKQNPAWELDSCSASLAFQAFCLIPGFINTCIRSCYRALVDARYILSTKPHKIFLNFASFFEYSVPKYSMFSPLFSFGRNFVRISCFLCAVYITSQPSHLP
jgi:hypothetical protein